MTVHTLFSNGTFEPRMFVEREPVLVFLTNDAVNSWMCVDIGANRRLQINHYYLRHSQALGYHRCVLRSWVLEGSNTATTPAAQADPANWTVLREHAGHASLREVAGADAAWPVVVGAGDDGYYRFFRIRITGPNSSGHHFLIVNGLEMYGRLRSLVPEVW